jgi:hypothetical protein
LSLLLLLGILAIDFAPPVNAVAPPTPLEGVVLNRSEPPDSVRVGSQTLRMTADAWRDFMPGGCAPRDHSLIVALRIRATDSTAVPSDLRVTSAMLVQGSARFLVMDGLSNEPYGPDLRALMRGPSWDIGAEVFVTARLQDNQGNIYVLRAPATRILKAS